MYCQKVRNLVGYREFDFDNCHQIVNFYSTSKICVTIGGQVPDVETCRYLVELEDGKSRALVISTPTTLRSTTNNFDNEYFAPVVENFPREFSR